MPERLGQLERAVEALVFASEAPIGLQEIERRLGTDTGIVEALEALAARHAGCGINLVRCGERWHFQTAPDLAHLLRETREASRKLSRAGIETLAIVAYHEPVSRAEIEAIRGVQISKGTLDVLIEAGWIAPAGRREAPGRPLTYATSPDFLSHFGLADRRDLPGIDDLRAAGLLDPVSVEEFDGQLETDEEGD
jgi:segregation and condensation protein B